MAGPSEFFKSEALNNCLLNEGAVLSPALRSIIHALEKTPENRTEEEI